jgi:hypothetical protein
MAAHTETFEAMVFLQAVTSCRTELDVSAYRVIYRTVQITQIQLFHPRR